MKDSDGNEHNYNPDFLVDDKLIEIKGDHLIDNQGNLINPFNPSEKTAKIMEAKTQCMKDNNVIVIKDKDPIIKESIEYMKKTYGPNWKNQFKVKSIS